MLPHARSPSRPDPRSGQRPRSSAARSLMDAQTARRKDIEERIDVPPDLLAGQDPPRAIQPDP